jgi:phage terminase large subunit GpA-like protein
MKSGGVRRQWELTRDRNEALDTRIYATAAALAEGLQRWGELEWSEAEAMAGERPTAATDAAPGHLRPGQVIRSSWLG